MLTIKNPASQIVESARLKPQGYAVCLLACALLAGCMPPGPRAFFEGKRLLERGDCSGAIESFTIATSILPTNALAWHFLGVACQQAGRAAEADTAYQRALSCDRDLSEAHYNLGCLWLDQNKLDRAKAEFTSFTLQKSGSVEGFVKLGTVQLRLREFGSADKSFSDALRLSATNREALNGLAIARLQRGRTAEAAQLFSATLKNGAVYAPALFNLAVLEDQYYQRPQSALERFRQYVSLKPAPVNAEAVIPVLRRLEQDLAAPVTPQKAVSVQSPLASTHYKPVSVAQPPQSLSPARQDTSTSAPPSRAAAASVPPATNPPVHMTLKQTAPPPVGTPTPPAARSAPDAARVRQAADAPGVAATPVQVEKLSPEPVIKTASDTAMAPAAAAPASNRPATPEEDKTGKRGLLQTLNPLNLLQGSDKPPARVTALPTLAASAASNPVSDAAQPREPESSAAARMASVPRYNYTHPPRPAPGNRAAAEKAFSQGLQAQSQHRPADAQGAYRKAVQLDPAYFKAHYNLALTHSDLGEADLAMRQYEVALALQPDSLDARYNFALLLKQRGYLTDAAAELKKVAASPNQGRAHLALGNLYAQQLGDPSAARLHYSKVLELEPRHPQAPAIRYWLTDNAK